MKVFIKFNIAKVCSLFLKEKLENLDLDFQTLALGEIEIDETIDSNKLKSVKEKLLPVGIEFIENQKGILVEKIKDAIFQMVFTDNPYSNLKSSAYLADKLSLGYGYLSNIFSEVTYTTIENFIIMQRIERAKQLIIPRELNLTEIAFLLNYSSLSHFSIQFKNSTGLTPSSFQRIIEKRRANLQLI